jgi:two-component system sensor histidine kinase MtrB
MPRTLAARIAVAFGVLAIVLWLAIGAGMFVVLRGLHADATSSSLADVAQTFAVRLRSAAVDRELQRVVATIRTEVAQADVTIHVIGENGRIVDIGAGDPSPTEPIAVPGDAKVGQTVEGMVAYTDGEVHDYAAVVLRAPASGAGRTILLSTIDRSGAAALRDVGRTLPGVILVTLLVGAPLVWLLARSVAGPLARLATRTRELTEPAASPPEPLALEGPKEVRALTERVNAMAAELALIRARETELLADLRHDLRTPLTVIGGYAAALADGTANGETATRAAAAIADETARLGRLVDELGAVERLRNGSAGLRLEPIAVDEVLRVTAERFTARASSDGSTIEVVEGADGLSLAADRLALDRILANLVDNALAVLAARGGGHVRLSARIVEPAASGSGPAIAFSVADDGPGFPPGGAERAFERFYRGDPSRSGPGSGLGLTIVRELARAHGGFTIAENLSPHGARVSAILPVAS